MIHYNYSSAQLEKTAEDLLKAFDPERLQIIKPIDVYAVIEKCLNVPYDWKYITPDQSILGLTAFQSGTTWVWPEAHYFEGMKPTKIYLEKGTILIDSTLTEIPDRGRENFTVMHEIFHQVLPHARCFLHRNHDYTHCTTSHALNSNRRPMTSLEICEYQANACAAAFLMPRDLLTRTVNKLVPQQLDLKSSIAKSLVKELATQFSVSQQAMRYRLLNLKLVRDI